MRRPLLALFLFLILVPPAKAGGPGMVLGANEGGALQKTFVAAKANLGLAKMAGFRAISLSEFWWPGLTEPQEYDRITLGNLDRAARVLGVPVYLSIRNNRGRFAPVTAEDRAQFVQFAVATARMFPRFRKIIIGNEPNLNLFWSPQFDVGGRDSAATAYEQMLAQTYDALKAVSKRIVVIGGAVSPRGHDNPNASSLSHSPTTFIRDLGRAYRASGRKKKIMDWFAFHPYGANSSEPPARHHPTSTNISIGDYDKLVRVLGQAFDGTKQPGSAIPIVYDEYGIESTIPKKKAKKYTGREPKSTKPVPPATQGKRYKQAIELAFCQPTVKTMFLFHAFDEPERGRWQSGVYYADHTPKPSLRIVRRAFQESRRGILARCPGMRLPVRATAKFPAPGKAASLGKRGSRLYFTLRCNIDCRYTSGAIDVARGKSVLTARGRAIGGKTKLVRLPAAKLKRGRYRIKVRLAAALNPGRSSRKSSRVFSVR